MLEETFLKTVFQIFDDHEEVIMYVKRNITLIKQGKMSYDSIIEYEKRYNELIDNYNRLKQIYSEEYTLYRLQKNA